MKLLTPNGPWKKWNFDSRLKVQRAGVQHDDPPLNQSLAQEEGLETLLILNLATLFPDWNLRLYSKENNLFSATDIEAIDAIGRRHIFEVKYGKARSRKYVVSQLLHYALQTNQHQDSRWFVDVDRNELRDWIAQRILGVWTCTRTETSSFHDRSCPPEEQRQQRLQHLLALLQDNAVTIETARTWGEEWLDELLDSMNSGEPPSASSGLCLHIVMPNNKVIDREELKVLGRLKDHGIAIHFWEVRITMADNCRLDGTLWARELLLHPVQKDSRKIKPAVTPTRPRASVLLAELCSQAMPDTSFEWTWRLRSPTSFALEVDVSRQFQPCNGLRLVFELGEETLKAEAQFSVPGHVSDTKADLKQDCKVPLFTVRDWVLNMAAPVDSSTLDSVRNMSAKSIKWAGSVSAGERAFAGVECRHSASRRQSYVQFDRSQKNIGQLLAFCSEAATEFLRVADKLLQPTTIEGTVAKV